MLGHDWYFGSTKKYTSIFGAIFNDIQIKKYDTTGKLVSEEKVPLKYAPKDKILIRNKEDPLYERKIAIKLPVMSFELVNFDRDPDRELATIHRIAAKIDNNPNYFYSQYTPNPFNFNFKLYIYVKNPEDGLKIIEQICYFFKPEYTVRAKLIDEFELEERDVPIVMNGSPQLTEVYEDNYEKRMMIMWECDFTLRGYLWGPVMQTPVIKFVTMNTRIEGSNNNLSSTTVQPGLTANGTPTNNANNSVDPLTIYVTDDYGFCEVDNDE
jgi:hypothetical protein